MKKYERKKPDPEEVARRRLLKSYLWRGDVRKVCNKLGVAQTTAGNWFAGKFNSNMIGGAFEALSELRRTHVKEVAREIMNEASNQNTNSK